MKATRICSADDCTGPAKGRGLCAGHYRRWRLERTDVPACSTEDCSRPSFTLGFCERHYDRWRRNGEGVPRRRDLIDRLVDFIDFGEDCWAWTGHVDASGYGRINAPGGTALAYRRLWLEVVGDIPRGLELDHLCRNKRCVNPDHMEPVTRRINSLRSDNVGGVNARKTCCVHGHEFTPENTYIRPSGSRSCRTCARSRDEARRVGKP